VTKNKIEKLEPCPRCNGEAECRLVSISNNIIKNYRVRCTKCELGSTEEAGTEDTMLFSDKIIRIDEANIRFVSGYNKAVEWWNDRT